MGETSFVIIVGKCCAFAGHCVFKNRGAEVVFNLAGSMAASAIYRRVIKRFFTVFKYLDYVNNHSLHLLCGYSVKSS